MQPPRATASEDNAAPGSLQADPQAPGQTTGVAGVRANCNVDLENKQLHEIQLFGEASANISYAAKEAIWASIVEKVNAVGVTRRTVNQRWSRSAGLQPRSQFQITEHYLPFTNISTPRVDYKALSCTGHSGFHCGHFQFVFPPIPCGSFHLW
ncbi:UNVERIFIED_CONTAM: hypothetical protein FKN15_048771 [Acipenser sinensis]